MIFEGGSSAGSGIANTAGASITNNGTLSFLNSSTGGSAGEGATIANNLTLNFGTLGATDTSSADHATIANGISGIASGTLNFNASTTAGNANITNNFGFVQFFDSSAAGSATITNNSTLNFFGSSTASNAAITNTQSITFSNTSTAGSATITSNNGGGVFIGDTASGGIARFIMNSGGTLDISDLTNGGTTAGSIEGDATSAVFLGANNLTVGGNNLSTTFAGVIQDRGDTPATGGALTKVGTGTLILSGTNTYTGPTTVSAGTLQVDGSIVTSNMTTVGGGTLSGTGTVGNTQVNSGILAPGPAMGVGTLSVRGSLAFQSAAFYMVGISGSSSSQTTVVANTATLGGATVEIANGSTVTPGVKYTILTTLKGGTVSGTFNATPITFDNLKGTLTYDATDVFLTFRFNSLAPLLPPNAPTNVVNTVNAIDTFITNGGTLPVGFQNLFNLSPAQLVIALTQRDGEAATDAEKGAFTLMTQFLDLLLDPFVDGRTGSLGVGASNFAPEQEASFPPDIALAYGALLKAPPKPAFEQRWSVWGSGFGGSATTNGNATIGSNNVTASDFGFAVGADYRYSPDTVLGFALAGAGTNWGLSQNLGGGRSDAFMLGGYGITHFGSLYLTGDLAFADHWFSTNRSAGGDQLTARFNGQSYGARVEAGYRYAMPVNGTIVGLTPYAAVQGQWFHTGAYKETDATGGGFALSFGAMNAHDTRSELGGRVDELTTLNGMPVQLRARVAWAHDWVSNPALGAVFQALPGGAFTVNGAIAPKDSALTTAGAQFYLTPRLSFLAKFDGEFASNAQTYAGTGTLRYAW
jgi:autotransporter-associated beta strand protein